MSIKSKRYKIIIPLLLPCLIGGGLLWIWLRLNDPQGEENANCDREYFRKTPSIDGWYVSGHTTYCSGFGGNSAVYIYVLPDGSKENRSNLVFRYAESSTSSEPKIEWKSNKQISISVDHVSEITKMKSSMGPIKIVYHIAKIDYPKKQ